MFGSLFHTFIVAQVMGLFFLIMGIMMLSHAGFYQGMIKRLKVDNPLIHITAAGLLLIGLFLVLIHNIWVKEPRVIITIICWLTLIKAVLWLALPGGMLNITKKISEGAGYYVVSAIFIILGILIMTKGFYLFLN